MGVASTKLLVSNSTIWPSNILLPNSVDYRKESYSQKILYKYLPNQCFCCFGFGHLAKNGPKFNKDTNKHVPNKTEDRFDGWTEVGQRKTASHVCLDKPHHVSINSLNEFPPLQNRYSTLHEEDDRSHEVNTLDHPSSYPSQQRFN